MKVKLLFVTLLFSACAFPFLASAQEVVQDTVTTNKAKVLEILDSGKREVPGLGVQTNFQTIKVEILDGVEKGKVVTVDNDYLNLEKSEVFYLRHATNDLEGRDIYTVSDPYRLNAIWFFVGLFILCVAIFGGKQGLRGLLSLVASLLFIYFLLLPGIIKGYSPVLVSIGVSSLIIILGSYITHGFNKTTSAAVLGMIATIILTGVLAYLAVKFTRLSGFSSEEAVYLNLDTSGTINFSGLLLGGILFGLLGVLYDAAIGQAVSVEELNRAGPHLPRLYIYQRAIRIGREHIGALVNTLAIAYVGVSLPLLLLYYNSAGSLELTLNREIFATEIIRIIIGSIGLVLAVPVTTLISTWFLVKKNKINNKDILEVEVREIEKIEHKHS